MLDGLTEYAKQFGVKGVAFARVEEGGTWKAPFAKSFSDAARSAVNARAGARTGDGEGLPAILAEEQGLDDDYNSAWNQFKRYVSRHALLLSLVIAALAWGVDWGRLSVGGSTHGNQTFALETGQEPAHFRL